MPEETEGRITSEDPAETTARVIMMLDAAIDSLRKRGFDRDLDDIEIVPDDDGFLPIRLTLRGKTVFIVNWRFDPFRIEGTWKELPRLGLFRRFWRWITGKKDARALRG